MRIFLNFLTIFGSLFSIATGIVLIVNYYQNIYRFFVWWPSGWIFFFLLLTVVLLMNINRGWKNLYLQKKYGPKHGCNRKVVGFGGSKVYLMENDKTIRWIENPETFLGLGYDWDEIEKLSKDQKHNYTGLPFPLLGR
jgi:hypothetical protein